MKFSPTISIVIPSYNGKLLLEQNLPNILNVLRKSEFKAEIIVVDDASADNSIEFIAQEYPLISILKNTENVGFSRTMNVGIKAAQYEWILALNNDMRLPENFFEAITKQIGERVFSISCTIKDGKGEKVLESSKVQIRRLGRFSVKDKESDKATFSVYSCGGCSLYNREKLLQLGGFDELFSPFYYEDLDLSLRGWLKGWQSIYTPETFCYHDHSVTIKNKFKQRFVKRIINRNKLIINYTYLRNSSFMVFIFASIVKYFYSLLFCFIPKRQAFVLAVHDVIGLRGEVRQRKTTTRKQHFSYDGFKSGDSE